jgi:hypothetical protein
VHHLEVIRFGWTGEAVSPEEVHSLAAVQVEQFFGEDLDGAGVVERGELLEGEEVDVVGRVDCLGDTEDAVCDGFASAEEGGVFDVVYSAERQIFLGKVGRMTYSRLEVCSMPTTLVMMASLSSGTLNQALNAATNCARISFPGCPNR